MAVQIFKAVVIMSLSGGAFAAALMLLSPLTRRILNPTHHYYIALAAVVMLLIPVSFGTSGERMPQSAAVQAESSMRTADKAPNSGAVLPESQSLETQSQSHGDSPFLKKIADVGCRAAPYLAAVWFVLAILLLCSKVEGYIWFTKRLAEHSGAADKPDNVPQRLAVRSTDMLQSPMITGIFRPTLYIPKSDLTPSEQSLILEHELVHYRRGDIVFKWLIMATKCIHWFNPIVYVLAQYIERECEASCDFKATRSMSDADKKQYMHTLVDMIERETTSLSFGTQMSAEKSGLKLRIRAVKHKPGSRRCIRAASAAVAAVLIFSGVYVSGCVNKTLRLRFVPIFESDKTEPPQNIGGESGRRYNGTDNDEKTNDAGAAESDSDSGNTKDSEDSLGNISDGEAITHDISDDNIGKANTDVLSENGDKIEYSAQSEIDSTETTDNTPTELKGENDGNDGNPKNNAVEEETEFNDGICGMYYVTYNGETPVVEGKYTSQNGCRAFEKNLNFGEDGKFYIYFKANMDTVMGIEIFDSETHKNYGGYKVPSGKDKAYMFCGFDPNRKYDIEIKSQSGSDWRIDGVYYIY